MAVTKKYPTQVVLVSTQAMKDHIVARSERDEVSQADKTREYVQAGMDLEAHAERNGRMWHREGIPRPAVGPDIAKAPGHVGAERFLERLGVS
jgi:hypothetical protein